MPTVPSLALLCFVTVRCGIYRCYRGLQGATPYPLVRVALDDDTKSTLQQTTIDNIETPYRPYHTDQIKALLETLTNPVNSFVIPCKALQRPLDS